MSIARMVPIHEAISLLVVRVLETAEIYDLI